MRRIVAATILTLALTGAPAAGAPLPSVIALPAGFFPEGITPAGGHDVFVGSLATGGVIRVDLRTGEHTPLVESADGPAVGLIEDRLGRLWVAGGDSGDLRVYDSETGQLLATAVLSGFLNDVAVIDDVAYVTDSTAPHLFKVTLDSANQPTVTVLPLTGDWQQVPNEFNANGIVATPDGSRLIVVQSVAPGGCSALYSVDPTTGVADRIEIDGQVCNGDGLELVGRRLHVVQNFSNSIATIRLDQPTASGTFIDVTTDPDFDVPTTAAKVGSRLYAVNAKFTTPPTPDTPYEIVAVQR
jgi:hypothetical protein